MSEQAKFQAWWDECGFNSVILRAAAWEAWMARAELNTTPAADTDPWVTQDRVPARVGIDEYRYASWTHEPDRWRPVNESGGWDDSANHGWVDDEGDTLLLRCRASQLPEVCSAEPQSVEDPDEWVVQDRVPARPGVDERRYIWSDGGVGSWADCASMNWSVPPAHGMKAPSCSATVELRCRRSDLPKVEQPEQWPKYYTGTSPGTAYVRRPSKTECIVVEEDGHEAGIINWCDWDDRMRKQLTEAEAMALLKKPESQPAKTRVRLWMRQCDRIVMASTVEVGGCDEIHYDAETKQFYVEQQ